MQECIFHRMWVGQKDQKEESMEGHEYRMNKRIKHILLSVLLAASLTLCGAGWYYNAVMLDDTAHIMYENKTVDVLLEDYSADKNGYYNKYNGDYLVLWGEVSSIAADGKSLTLTALNQDGKKSVTCKTGDIKLADEVKGLATGSEVQIYGKVSVNWFTKDTTLTMHKLEAAGDAYSDNLYSSVSGADYDLDNMPEIILTGADVTYHIPQSWTAVEKTLENERLEGYQYCLNEINRATAKAESLFVFFFDYEKCLRKLSDRANPQEVQVAIINNILKKDPGTSLEFTRTNFNTYYDATYNYYGDTYTNPETRITYRVEFVFETVGNEGLLVYLYVVNNENELRHIDDVMMVLRSVK